MVTLKSDIVSLLLLSECLSRVIVCLFGEIGRRGPFEGRTPAIPNVYIVRISSWKTPVTKTLAMYFANRSSVYAWRKKTLTRSIGETWPARTVQAFGSFSLFNPKTTRPAVTARSLLFHTSVVATAAFRATRTILARSRTDIYYLYTTLDGRARAIVRRLSTITIARNRHENVTSAVKGRRIPWRWRKKKNYENFPYVGSPFGALSHSRSLSLPPSLYLYGFFYQLLFITTTAVRVLHGGTFN